MWTSMQITETPPTLFTWSSRNRSLQLRIYFIYKHSFCKMLWIKRLPYCSSPEILLSPQPACVLQVVTGSVASCDKRNSFCNLTRAGVRCVQQLRPGLQSVVGGDCQESWNSHILCYAGWWGFQGRARLYLVSSCSPSSLSVCCSIFNIHIVRQST